MRLGNTDTEKNTNNFKLNKMNEKHLEYFKKSFSHTGFRFTLKDGAIVVEKPRKPIYTDPENGDEFFEGELSYWFDVSTFEVYELENKKHLHFKATSLASKSYNTRLKCELALMIFIAKKHNI